MLKNIYVKKKEQFFLLNDILNTFYLRLYGVGHMVKDYSDTPHELLFPISRKDLFISTIPQAG